MIVAAFAMTKKLGLFALSPGLIFIVLIFFGFLSGEG